MLSFAPEELIAVLQIKKNFCHCAKLLLLSMFVIAYLNFRAKNLHFLFTVGRIGSEDTSC